jgi:hypothetical protein
MSIYSDFEIQLDKNKITKEKTSLTPDPTQRKEISGRVSKKGLEKSIRKEKSAGKDKSAGRVLTEGDNRTLNKTKTSANIKPIMNKTLIKQTPDKSSEKTLIKSKSTLKVADEEKPIQQNNKPLKKESSRNTTNNSIQPIKNQISRTPTIKHSDSPGKPNLSSKQNQVEKISIRTIKKEDKSPFSKQSSKGDLIRSMNTQNKSKNDFKKPLTPKSGDVFLKSHPNKEINISSIIGIEPISNPNDELLIKEGQIHIHLQDSTINHLTDTSIYESKSTELDQNKMEFGEILEDRWHHFFSHFLTIQDCCKLLLLNKTFARLILTQILEELENWKKEPEQKIKTLSEKYSKEELNNSKNQLKISRGTIKALELLSDPIYSRLFCDENSELPKKDITLVYRILFQLLNYKPISSINDDTTFWKETKLYFGNDLEQKLKDAIQNFDLSVENIFKVKRLIGSNLQILTPNYYSRLCGTTGLFIFLIKDVLDFSGIFIEKITPISRVFKNEMYNLEVLNKRIEHIRELLNNKF